MKEIMAIIRMNMVGKTKDALSKAGFPAFTCRKVLGRGKGNVKFSMFSEVNSDGIQDKELIEQLSESHRLIPKRMFEVVVKDEDVKDVIQVFMDINHTGNPGDGKIFVIDVIDAVRVRTGEQKDAAI
jgi:nitrogen regulatory protein PII 2